MTTVWKILSSRCFLPQIVLKPKVHRTFFRRLSLVMWLENVLGTTTHSAEKETTILCKFSLPCVRACVSAIDWYWSVFPECFISLDPSLFLYGGYEGRLTEGLGTFLAFTPEKKFEVRHSGFAVSVCVFAVYHPHTASHVVY